MLKNFSWVLPGKLAGCAIPGMPIGAEESDYIELSKVGIKVLVSLQSPPGEIQQYCDQAGIEWIYHPIDDFSIPTDHDVFDLLIDLIIDKMDSDLPVCVHCYAGVGRTGLVLSCVVGKCFALRSSLAISTVRKTRLALDTEEQNEFVSDYLLKAIEG